MSLRDIIELSNASEETIRDVAQQHGLNISEWIFASALLSRLCILLSCEIWRLTDKGNVQALSLFFMLSSKCRTISCSFCIHPWVDVQITMRKTVRNRINGYLCSSSPTLAKVIIHSLDQGMKSFIESCVIWSVIKYNSFWESVQMHRKWEWSISLFIAAVWNIRCCVSLWRY